MFPKPSALFSVCGATAPRPAFGATPRGMRALPSAEHFVVMARAQAIPCRTGCSASLLTARKMRKKVTRFTGKAEAFATASFDSTQLWYLWSMNAAILVFGVSVLVVVTMDAATLVAAAVAVACDQSCNAALEDVLRDRELAAMRAADLESQVAQRLHVWSQQLPRPQQLPVQAYTRTWQEAYNQLETDYQQALDTLQEVGVANNNGDSERVAELVRQELGDDQSASLSEAEAASDSDAPESDDSDEPRCARCGDRHNLTVLQQTGVSADAVTAARTYCVDCLSGP